MGMGRAKKRRRVGKGGKISHYPRVRLLLGGIEVSYLCFIVRLELMNRLRRCLPSGDQSLGVY